LDISAAVRKVCLSFPDTEETDGHSMANFKVRGKTFATYAINHHGDGRVALWLEAPSGSQALHIDMDPEHYFKPQYVGPKGWLGVELNKRLEWKVISKRVREAYEKVAPAELVSNLAENIKLKEPIKNLKPEEIDPFATPKAKKFLEQLDKYCENLPETSKATGFGNPQWKAGKKTFVCVHRYSKRLCIQVWVGEDQQSFMVSDKRFKIPPYVGHNGWIDLDVESSVSRKEIHSLVMQSYRHFALQRMLKKLDE
jgi:predicted DNA-binding protein (MmcQ/YjbR family)